MTLQRTLAWLLTAMLCMMGGCSMSHETRPTSDEAVQLAIDRVDALMISEAFAAAGLNERQAQANQLLDELSQQQLLHDIEYDAISHTISFTYANGMLGCILLTDGQPLDELPMN